MQSFTYRLTHDEQLLEFENVIDSVGNYKVAKINQFRLVCFIRNTFQLKRFQPKDNYFNEHAITCATIKVDTF